MERAIHPRYLNQIAMMTRNTDVFMGVAVVGILVFMVIPLPPMLLDLLLSFSITLSLVILLVGMYINRPLDLSSFPSILLLATLFRLSLNVASTRIILLHGSEGTAAAGKVIMAFGSFVVGGNYVVGVIVFLVLVIINFVVITKGAGRIAEVAARFTLDAMPGKQMSIDADLNAGLISEAEARTRRLEISSEAEYYGAMDGANKFVRGDAIAGIIITLINILAGLTIGVFQNNMSFGEAAQNYTLLTVGDGLVTQIPALIISTAAGVVVSRAGTDKNLGDAIYSQIMRQPRAIAIAAAVLFCFALVPGLPTIPFVVLAIIAATAAYAALQMQKAREMDAARDKARQKTAAQPEEKFDTIPLLDTLALEVGYNLVPLVDVQQGAELLERIKSIRRQIARESGVVVPPVHIQDNLQLRPGEYVIFLKGNEVARGESMPNHYRAMNPASGDMPIEGIKTSEPTYGLPAVWIKAAARENALQKGFTVVDLPTVLTTHLSDVIRRYGHELIGRQEVQKMLDHLKVSHPKVVEELIPGLLPLGAVVRVLQNLLMEQVPIRDFLTILETLADWAPAVKDMDVLTEQVRQALARTITRLYLTHDNTIPLITLDQEVENVISGAIQKNEQGRFMALDPTVAQNIINNLARALETFTGRGLQPIVMCSPQIRLQFKKLVDRFIPNLVVLSYNDIITSVRIESMGTVRLSHAD